MADGSSGGRLPANPLLGGRYRLESRVGSGGMGVVYRATDETLGRPVAVKLFRDSEAADLGRKTSETRLLAALNHPSLVTLYDARIDGDGDAYLVMEYVDGPTLRTRIADGPVSPVDAARMARDLGEALHVVHSAGVVHRDIKPANVLLRRSLTPGEEFTATLADFGIAHLVGSSRLTTPGTLLGTAAYLSPEQVRGSEPAPSSDIYSLGLVLLEALTGARVFGQPVVHEAALARLTLDPDIPGSLGYGWKSLLTAMTARDPQQRPTALEVAAASHDLRSDGAAAVETTAAATSAGPMPGAATTQASLTVAAQEPALAATRVMAVSDEPTVQFAAAASGPSPRSPRSRRWGLLLAGLGAAAVVGAVLVWASLTGADPSPLPATTPSTSQAPADPAVDPTTGDDPSSEEPVSVTDPAEEPAEPTPAEPEPSTPEPGVTSEPATPPEPGTDGTGTGGTGNNGPGNNGNGNENPGKQGNDKGKVK
ncbi:protein kinase [Agreia sp. PsM10]|uniref:serine/threonine-protein kinase n=1 Tax=Agreia sp. PsM10 TaxID=3030533 RepID=UPI00263AB4DC|nr:serine/threonine protein kinase [Agreia sp. PsM10]MDN4640936.1 protein kinase [Agreia sp. PsM10]